MTESDVQLAALTRGLVRHFRRVQQTRMQDMPILNPALDVQAVGFERTHAGCLGILITPWFINLMLLPCEGDDWQDRAIGSTQTHAFASGSYEFIMAEDPAIGRYQACSLLSPVLELPDQGTAVELALAALQAIHDPEARDLESSTCAADIERAWHGAQTGDQADDQKNGDAPRTTETGATETDAGVSGTGDADHVAARAAPISRRDFLRGRLRPDGERS